MNIMCDGNILYWRTIILESYFVKGKLRKTIKKRRTNELLHGYEYYDNCNKLYKY